MTSAVFNQNPSKAKKLADSQPLVITDHGEASYVLVSYSDFQAHWRKSKRLLDALRDPNAAAGKSPERQVPAFQDFMRDFEVEEAFLSSVSIMEIRFGIQREQAKDREFARELTRWLNEIVLAEFAGRILSFDLAVAIRAGALPTAERRPSADAMIAATGLEHNLQVVTRNVSHFEALGVACLDPWRYVA